MSERAWRSGPITWHPTVLAPILQAELLFVLGAVTSALVDERVRPAALGVNVALALGLLWLATAAHEAGHALAARLCGLRVVRVQVGMGRPLLGKRMLWTDVRFGVLLSGGGVQVQARTPRLARCRVAAMIAGRPCVNLVLLALAAPYSELPAWVLPAGAFDPLGAFVFANVFVATITLLPSRFRGRVSDGLALLALPFAPRPEPDVIGDVNAVLDAVEADAEGDDVRAKAILEHALERRPDAPLLRYVRAAVEVEDGELERARGTLHALLECDLEPELRGWVESGLAWTVLVADDRASADEALEASQRARAALPWRPEPFGTAGAILVWRDAVERGLPLLRSALARNEEWTGAAHNAAWIAVAHAKRGRLRKACARLAMARRLDPTCTSLRFAQAAIEEASAVPALAGVEE